jgi:cation diffusion facilitator CzcD-associated flavoprotein CzcO
LALTHWGDSFAPRPQPYAPHQKIVSSHLRAYATLHGLNINDEPTVAYSTRVERLDKAGQAWNLTLKRVKQIESVDFKSGEREAGLEAEWWQESFDAVVVSQGLEDGGPHVPDIPGIVEWSKARTPDGPDGYSIYHSRVYRRPERYAGKVCV